MRSLGFEAQSGPHRSGFPFGTSHLPWVMTGWQHHNNDGPRFRFEPPQSERKSPPAFSGLLAASEPAATVATTGSGR